MTPVAHVHSERVQDIHIARPHGLLHGVRWMANTIFRRTHKERWLSTFSMDHVLLFGAGLCSIAYQIDMLLLRQRLVDKEQRLTYPETLHIGQWVLVVQAIVAIYMSILMMGFLFTTLEYNIAAALGRKNEFRLMITVSLVLWLLDFLTVYMNRTQYTAYWARSTFVQRALTSMGQIFVTHSAAMLGAVMFGHSCHFHKSPDLTWGTLLKKVFPLGLCGGAFALVSMERRMVHAWELNHPLLYRWVAAPWPYLEMGFAIFVSVTMLGLAYTHREVHHADHATDHNHDGSTESMRRESISEESEHEVTLVDYLDYDAALIVLTLTLALFYNVCMIYKEKPDNKFVHGHSALFAEVARLMLPVSLCAFTLGVWRRPPVHKSPAKVGVWLALFFCWTEFWDFQMIEDCQISSDLAPCCRYPGFDSWNKDMHRADMCGKAARCLSKAKTKELHGLGNFSAFSVYCSRDLHHEAAPSGGEGDDAGQGGEGDEGTGDEPHAQATERRSASAVTQVKHHDEVIWLRQAVGKLCQAGSPVAERCAEMGVIPGSSWLAAAGPGRQLFVEDRSGGGGGGGEHGDSHSHAKGEGDPKTDYGECCCCRPEHQSGQHHCVPKDWINRDNHDCPVLDADAGSGHHGRRLGEAKKLPTNISVYCQQELLCRWRLFSDLGGPYEEVKEHRDEESAVFTLFETIGVAATVEMYFTIMGVLLKVILLTQHKNSAQIVAMAAHHHHIDDHTGEAQVVAVLPGASRGTVVARRSLLSAGGSSWHGPPAAGPAVSMTVRASSTFNATPGQPGGGG